MCKSCMKAVTPLQLQFFGDDGIVVCTIFPVFSSFARESLFIFYFQLTFSSEKRDFNSCFSSHTNNSKRRYVLNFLMYHLVYELYLR